MPGQPDHDPDPRLHALHLGRADRPARGDEDDHTHPPGQLIPRGQRERATPRLARQGEPVQAKVTGQRGQVIRPAGQGALALVIRAAVAGLVGRDPAQASGPGRPNEPSAALPATGMSAQLERSGETNPQVSHLYTWLGLKRGPSRGIPGPPVTAFHARPREAV
jgi:hypothetical protein